jgi:PTS system fructose-specific IIC component
MRRRLELVRSLPSGDPFAPHPALFLPAVEVRSKEALFSRLAIALAAGVVLDARALLEALIERESSGNTGVGFGLGVPHARSTVVATTAVACARLRPPLDYGAPDGMSVGLVLLAVAPCGVTGALFMPLLDSIVALARDEPSRRRLLGISTFQEFGALLVGILKPLVMEALSL